MTPQDARKLIAEARELDAKATKPPWEPDYENERGPEYIAGPVHVYANWHDMGGQAQADADRNFCRRSRTLLVELADALERTDAKLTSVVALMDEWKFNGSVPVTAIEKALSK